MYRHIMKYFELKTCSQRLSGKFFGATLLGMTLFLGCASSPPVVCQLSLSPKPDLPVRGISAHRGGQLGCPDNTTGAFHRAICRGAHQIELDVRATADNVIVVAHDDSITTHDQTLRISDSTLAQVKTVKLPTCTGDGEQPEQVPTLEEALAIMPRNIWVNVDIKDNDPRVAQLVAETVAKAQRFDQVIFSARDKAAPTIRQIAKEAETQSWVGNMSRELFRSQYVDATIRSCADFIQLVEVPYLPFVRGKPSHTTMDRLDEAGIRVNYSWLRGSDEEELQQELQDLFDRGVDFVLVDHVEEGMKAANNLGIPRLVPHWDHSSRPTDQPPFHCPSPQ